MATIFARTEAEKIRLADLIRNSDKPLAVEIEEGDIRTISQNSRYWAAIVPAIQRHLEQTLGEKHSKEAIHLFLKTERYGKKVDVVKGAVLERCARSSKMTVKQFAKYSVWAELYALNELGVDPAEIDYHARGEL